jgi:hypothetical protein
MNIVSLIMQYLGPVIVGKLASSLGINQTIAQKIISAALPAILGGLIGRVGQPGGGQALADAIGKQDGGLLGSLGSLVGGAQQAKIAEQGMGTLGSLLGGSGVGALASAAAKFGGVNETVTKGLIGMLAPAVLGTLGQQQKSAGLDAGGLAKMLIGQKDNVQAALPGDFAKMLGGSGLLDGLGSAVKAAAPAPVVAAPAISGGMWRWLAAAAAAVLAAWYFLGSGSAPKQVKLPKPPQIMAGTVDIGSGLGASLGSLQNALVGIKDQATAQSALPQLRAAQSEIDRLSNLAGSLPAESKKSLASYVAQALPLLMPVINNLLANSSVGPVVKPVLDIMVGKLLAMSRV